MHELLRDIRHGVRSLARDRAYSSTFIATIAVCFAANSATYTIVDSVLLRPLPVPDSESILLMANRYPGAGVTDSFNSGAGDYFDRLEAISVFQEQAMFNMGGQTIEIAGAPRRVDAMTATPSLFGLLQVPPALGRTFDEEEGEIGSESKVILSYGLWQELYGGDPSAVGRELRLSSKPHTIIGVMPQDFLFVDPDIRLWTPQTFTPEDKLSHHNNNFYNVGRLKPGATLEQAQAQVDVLNAANLDKEPELRQLLIDAKFHTKVLQLREMMVGDVRSILYLLWGGALFVLLIGVLNIVNLSLVRLTLRRKELATRQALGAGVAQSMRQLILENVLAATAGGALGVALGAALLKALRSFGLEQLPRAAEIHMTESVALAALGIAAAVGLLIGCAALSQGYRTSLSQTLRADGRGGSTGRGTNRVRQSLVAAQIGFAFVLLLGAGLLAASLRELLRVNPGFRTEGVLTLSTRAPSTAYPEDQDRRTLLRRSLAAIRALPGVESAGATNTIPFGGNNNNSVIFAEGYQMKPGESVVSPRQLRVTPGYFETMDIQLVKGRFFNEHDDENATPAIIVDERLAERFWPGEDPIGRRLYQPDNAKEILQTNENTRWLTVVGVVPSVRLDSLEGSGNLIGAYYFALAQSPQSFFTIAVKAAAGSEPSAVTRAVRETMARIDPELALFDVHTMDERADLSLASRRTAMALAMGFGGVALFLSAIGIYGLLAYHVTLRRREIGIRMALGSTSSGIVNLVLREGFLLAGAGLLLGAVGAAALQKVIANEVYGVSALDPLVIVSVAALLATVVATASAVPARRAVRIDPSRAINCD
ncbi:MAG: FtsX-like permease family protein [Acidobacteria bacterium]|nr:FtsX-like permease family protein [Acidobacteriota bacterium]